MKSFWRTKCVTYFSILSLSPNTSYVCVFIILLYQYFRQVTLFPVCLYIRYRNKAGCTSYDEERKECDSGSSMGATRNNPMYVGGVLLTNSRIIFNYDDSIVMTMCNKRILVTCVLDFIGMWMHCIHSADHSWSDVFFWSSVENQLEV